MVSKELRELQELVRRAAEVFDCHIDEPQVCSHAELRSTAWEFRAMLGLPTKGNEEEAWRKHQFPGPPVSSLTASEN